MLSTVYAVNGKQKYNRFCDADVLLMQEVARARLSLDLIFLSAHSYSKASFLTSLLMLFAPAPKLPP